MSVSRLVEKGFALVMGATAGQHSACPRPDTAGRARHGRIRLDTAGHGRTRPDTAGHGQTRPDTATRIGFSRGTFIGQGLDNFFSEDYKKK